LQDTIQNLGGFDILGLAHFVTGAAGIELGILLLWLIWRKMRGVPLPKRLRRFRLLRWLDTIEREMALERLAELKVRKND